MGITKINLGYFLVKYVMVLIGENMTSITLKVIRKTFHDFLPYVSLMKTNIDRSSP